MPKVVIVYDSKTGNTEKMAEAVAKGVRSVEGVEAELCKLGTCFPISILDKADAVIFGSPSIYGNATPEMRAFFQSAIELKEAGRLKLRDKIGAAFASYAWDGGWVTEILAEALKTFGIRLVPPLVSAFDSRSSMGERIGTDFLQKCKELGKTVAGELVRG